VPALVKLLVSSHDRYDTYAVKRSAATALGRIGDASAVPALEAAKSQTPAARNAASAALKKIGTHNPQKVLTKRRVRKA